MLSIAFMATATGGMGWLGLKALDALGSNQVVVAAARILVAALLFATVLLGGKGIQAASRISAATGDEQVSIHLLTKRRFSWQGLLMIFAVIVGVAVEAIITFVQSA